MRNFGPAIIIMSISMKKYGRLPCLPPSFPMGFWYITRSRAMYLENKQILIKMWISRRNFGHAIIIMPISMTRVWLSGKTTKFSLQPFSAEIQHSPQDSKNTCQHFLTEVLDQGMLNSTLETAEMPQHWLSYTLQGWLNAYSTILFMFG